MESGLAPENAPPISFFVVGEKKKENFFTKEILPIFIACVLLVNTQLNLYLFTTRIGKVIANFSTSWCGPCTMISPFYYELSEKYLSLMFLTIDVDEHTISSKNFSEFISSRDIKATPTFFFLKDGEQIDKLVGANKPELQKKITVVAERHVACEPQPQPHGTIAIRISKGSNTYNARNNRLTSQYIFLRYFDFGFHIMDLGSHFIAFPLFNKSDPAKDFS
ncbi:hypothetical protein H5410_028066 [Solanum commersonii]|uniref:Thioredoxin domain-containing protein n=1 Tax=Solanum commersonii TaxID=4109 RepID=A0A9J5Z6E0_SOLCO|nr:hypothetical protein H5410_028066 [Solanum commersonii]